MRDWCCIQFTDAAHYCKNCVLNTIKWSFPNPVDGTIIWASQSSQHFFTIVKQPDCGLHYHPICFYLAHWWMFWGFQVITGSPVQVWTSGFGVRSHWERFSERISTGWGENELNQLVCFLTVLLYFTVKSDLCTFMQVILLAGGSILDPTCILYTFCLFSDFNSHFSTSNV